MRARADAEAWRKGSARCGRIDDPRGGSRVRLEESQNSTAGLDRRVWQMSALLVPKALEPCACVAPEGLS